MAKTGKSILERFRRRALRSVEETIKAGGRRPLKPKTIATRRRSQKRLTRLHAERRKARQLAALKAAYARQAAARAARVRDYGCLNRLLLVMAPGHWYGAPEIGRAAGLARNSLHGTLYQRAVKNGLVDRARNAAFDPRLPNGIEPRYLWRLTSKGEAVREMLVPPA